MLTWLAHAMAPLQAVVFVLGADHVTWAELLGFVTGAGGVWLTVESRIANFPVGIANSAFFLVLFATARLWADAGLQVLYIVLGFTGWWQWLHGGDQRRHLVVRRARPWMLVAGLGFVVLGTWGLTVGLGAAHDVAPFWDALTTCLSLAAQALLNAKRVQNWLFWMAADCVYVPLYVVKRLDLTAIVYVLFLALCVLGLRAWQRAERTVPAAPAAPVATAEAVP